MKLLKIIVMLMLLMLLMQAGCANFTGNNDQYTVGSVYQDSIQIGAKTVPLPEGAWTVIATGVVNEFRNICLLKEHQDKLFSYIWISVESPFKDARYGYNRSENLDRKDMLHVVKNENRSGEAQDGWYINHVIASFNPSEKYKIYRDRAAYIKEKGYRISSNMIGVTHRLTGRFQKEKYLHVNYYYNPEAEGITTKSSDNWSTSEWHVMRIDQSPEKVAFVEALKKEHTALHEKIKLGFGFK